MAEGAAAGTHVVAGPLPRIGRLPRAEEGLTPGRSEWPMHSTLPHHDAGTVAPSPPISIESAPGGIPDLK